MSPENIASLIRKNYKVNVEKLGENYRVSDNFGIMLELHQSLCSTKREPFICIHVRKRRFYDEKVVNLLIKFPYSFKIIKDKDIYFYGLYLTNKDFRKYVDRELDRIIELRFSY